MVLVDGSKRAESAGGDVADGSAGGGGGGSGGPSQPSCRPRTYSFHVCRPITMSPLNPS